jgi:hypothetical protein
MKKEAQFRIVSILSAATLILNHSQRVYEAAYQNILAINGKNGYQQT